VNARGGVRADGLHELVIERYDSKGQNEEALSALRAAMTAVRIIMQGNSSATGRRFSTPSTSTTAGTLRAVCCI
jgi:hypothetical protein